MAAYHSGKEVVCGDGADVQRCRMREWNTGWTSPRWGQHGKIAGSGRGHVADLR